MDRRRGKRRVLAASALRSRADGLLPSPRGRGNARPPARRTRDRWRQRIILPKATPEKLQAWAQRTARRFPLLPILETRDILDAEGRREMAAACADYRDLIPRVRIGANDLFALLGGLRRARGKTIYETPLGRVVDALIEVFSGVGLPLSGSVFDRIDDLETLARECRDDVARGLFAKTALNPLQVAVITESYHPDPGEIEEAQRILDLSPPPSLR